MLLRQMTSSTAISRVSLRLPGASPHYHDAFLLTWAFCSYRAHRRPPRTQSRNGCHLSPQSRTAHCRLPLGRLRAPALPKGILGLDESARARAAKTPRRFPWHPPAACELSNALRRLLPTRNSPCDIPRPVEFPDVIPPVMQCSSAQTHAASCSKGKPERVYSCWIVWRC
jgi:hypothetical protein